ncbi:MAG: D-tyrosyl-tRNA(Tyr) deacylase [Lachnospiraceae bacterium]|nr:D-tyrosyl-tRNA(Tyr) deacylase [Lachnospiraceae bacterium]
MRAVVTRVNEAAVTIEGERVAHIGKGLLVLLGVHKDDSGESAKWVADRICGLRIFEDDKGKMNINPSDAGAELLIVSQFTLYADISSRRPGFSDAARPDKAIPLYELVVKECRERGFHVETGEFGADMLVQSVNDGPVTIIIEK